MTKAQFRVLGPLEVVVSRGAVEIRSPRQRAIVALLVLHAGTLLGVERLIDEIWGESPPDGAAHALEVHISTLRRRLGPNLIETRAGGYRLRSEAVDVDLHAFERLVAEGEGALASDRPAVAADNFAKALSLWRGQALEDLTSEHAARAERVRLDELRTVVLERRIDADLASGRHLELIPELRRLVAEAPLQEAFQARLMLALYRSGRQAEALETYRQARSLLDVELGVEPGPELEELQRAILTHDPGLLPPSPDAMSRDVRLRARGTGNGAAVEAVREIVVTSEGATGLRGAIDLATGLARTGRRGLLLARIVPSGEGLTEAAADLRTIADTIKGISSVRTATFTTTAWGPDVAALATRMDADLVIVGGVDPAPDGSLPPSTMALLSEASAQVALILPSAAPDARVDVASGPIVVPFGGSEHDWAALELGAWLCMGLKTSLVVAGADAPGSRGDRSDASRLLADACLLLQRALGVRADPALIGRSPDSIVSLATTAAATIVGMPDRWRAEGVGRFRIHLARSIPGLVVSVRQGIRPGGLAPAEALSRYTWSIRPTP